MPDNVVLDLGWGRLVFGQTFSDPDDLTEVLRREGPGRRDVCMYASEAHVVVARSPHELFIDPSHTYRLRFSDESLAWSPTGITVRPLESPQDAEEMNRVYVRCGMVPARVQQIWDNHVGNDAVTYLVAVRDTDGAVVGTVTGVDHERLFDDPEHGSSLWSLAVDPAAGLPGVGELLTRAAGRALPHPGPRLHGPVRGARQCRGDRAVREAGVRARPGAVHQAQERHQRAAVHRHRHRRPSTT